MKPLKFIRAFFSEPKFEAIWAVIFLVAFVYHIAKHTTHTATGWDLTLAGWDLGYAVLTAFCFGTSIATAVNYWKGRA